MREKAHTILWRIFLAFPLHPLKVRACKWAYISFRELCHRIPHLTYIYKEYGASVNVSKRYNDLLRGRDRQMERDRKTFVYFKTTN